MLGAKIASITIGWVRLENGLTDHNRRFEELVASDETLMKSAMADAHDLADTRTDIDGMSHSSSRAVSQPLPRRRLH